MQGKYLNLFTISLFPTLKLFVQFVSQTVDEQSEILFGELFMSKVRCPTYLGLEREEKISFGLGSHTQ